MINNMNSIAEQVAARMNSGYTSSEAVLWAGAQVFPHIITDPMLKLATPFAGGIGCTYDGLCGALTGGVMVIGAVFGRMDGVQDYTLCQELASKYFKEFKNNFKYVNCDDLKLNWRGKLGQETCSILAQRAVLCLFEILEEQKAPRGFFYSSVFCALGA